MALKKKVFKDTEIPLFDEAVVYKRRDFWHFRMWLAAEGKYVRKSLSTKSRDTALERAKELYLDLYANQKMGKAYFSITVAEGIKKYLSHRQQDVETGVIVPGRHLTIRTHLAHWQNIIGATTKLNSLTRTTCENYYQQRTASSNTTVKPVTVQNEQSTINSCLKYLFKQGLCPVDGFDYKKLPSIDRKSEAARRATLTSEEYISLVRALKSYAADKKADDAERFARQLVRHYVLIAANSGLRVGEQRKLRWNDVEVFLHEERQLARVHVRAETSKVRTSRIFICRSGEHFSRWRSISKPENSTNLVFSVNGKTEFGYRTLLNHFHKAVQLAGIKDAEERGIVPYSLRHFMITQRIMSGLSFREVADMCGTSVAQIEKTYYHLNDEIRLTSALADYRRNSDGTLKAVGK